MAETQREKEARQHASALFYLLMAALAILGLFLLASDVPFFQHLGGALLIAAILGSTVDWFLKKQLMGESARAALGLLVDPELQPELNWIYNQTLLWTKWRVRVKLIPHPDCVIAEIVWRRTLVNRGEPTEPWLQGSMDEWGLPGRKTSIKEYRVIHRGTTYEIGNGANVSAKGHSVKARLDKPITMKKGEEIEWLLTCEQPHHHSGELVLTTRYPVLSVEVYLDIPDTFDFSPIFDARMKYDAIPLGPTTHEIKGVLLPHHGFRLRWWKK